MKTTIKWTEKMMFEGDAADNKILMDAKAPIGTGKGMTPKEMVAVAASGCSAMDVMALMKKHRQPVESLTVDSDVDMLKGVNPAIFTKIDLAFNVKGAVDPAVLMEAVKLSQTKYCSISAMLVRTVPIFYRVFLNDQEIGAGKAEFGEPS